MVDDNSAPFPQLRAAYLRAIARAWRDEKYLKELVDASEHGRGALPKLEKDFGFKFPFNVNFDISVHDRPIWKPIGTKGWFGFADRFDISFPAPPRLAEDRAAVLARYIAEFPSLLGASTDKVSEAPPDFASFGVITARVIALAWQEREFAALLYHDKDARGLVQDAMDFLIPWNFKLGISEAPGESSDSDAYWAKFPRSVITVNLPIKPELGVEPVALASYNDTGGQYPFTCG